MFGVVPRVLWERVSPPDELNRVRLNTNCLFIETASERILVETGIGEKWSEKETQMYAISRRRPFADSLHAITGCRPDDITIVVNTHLHFDHAGGNTIGTAAVPQFPNARYFVSRSEFDHANNPHERDRASYLAPNWRSLEAADQIELKPDNYEAVDGLSLETIIGHSKTMQTWRLTRGGETLVGFADLIPTHHHLSPAWIMGYDLYPAETLEYKKKVLPRAIAENWMCLFYHDPETPLCRLMQENGKIISKAIS